MRKMRAVTLLETMVTIVILGVLASVGYVTFNHTRAGVTEEVAQETLRAVALAEDSSYAKLGTFMGASALSGAEPAYTYVEGSVASGTPNQVSVYVSPGSWTGGGARVSLATITKDGTCVGLSQGAPNERGAEVTSTSSAGACTGFSISTKTGQAW